MNILYNIFMMNILQKYSLVKTILEKSNKKERSSYEKRSLIL